MPRCLVYLTVLAIGCLSANSRQSDATEPITIGSRRELFVDDYLIDRLAGVELRMHHPVARETVWSESNQTSGKWWGGANRSVSVFKDGQIYRMYYRDHARVTNGWTIKGGFGDEDIGCCYAESKDGIHWKRVPVNRYHTEDLKVNNIIFAGTGATGFAVFKDSNPNCPPEM